MPVLLFIPCLIDQAAPQVAEAAAALLTRLGVTWRYPAEQTCCGQFAWTLGDLPTARRLMRHFLKVFAGADAVVCPSASCTHMVRRHYPLLAETPAERDAARRLAGRTYELSEWLVRLGPLPWKPRRHVPLALHRACKARQLGSLAGAARLLAQVEGLVLHDVSPHFSCCGFGGVFKTLEPDIARTIGQAYLDAVAATGAAGLVSLEAGCLIHLQGLAAPSGAGLTFSHLAEVLLP
jgi:L-lactate dehydrogenase complex protein LldE